MTLIDGRPDGAVSADGKVSGTYLHGLFDSDAFRRRLLAEFGLSGGQTNFRGDVDAALDEIASELDGLVGFDRILHASALIGR